MIADSLNPEKPLSAATLSVDSHQALIHVSEVYKITMAGESVDLEVIMKTRPWEPHLYIGHE